MRTGIFQGSSISSMSGTYTSKTVNLIMRNVSLVHTSYFDLIFFKNLYFPKRFPDTVRGKMPHFIRTLNGQKMKIP